MCVQEKNLWMCRNCRRTKVKVCLVIVWMGPTVHSNRVIVPVFTLKYWTEASIWGYVHQLWFKSIVKMAFIVACMCVLHVLTQGPSDSFRAAPCCSCMQGYAPALPPSPKRYIGVQRRRKKYTSELCWCHVVSAWQILADAVATCHLWGRRQDVAEAVGSDEDREVWSQKSIRYVPQEALMNLIGLGYW